MTQDVLWVLPLALVLGAGGPAYQKLLHFSRVAKRLPFALLWSGLVVGVLALIEPKVWGNGDAALMGILQDKTMLLGIVSVLASRLVATTFCVGTGTVGGVFTPTLFTARCARSRRGSLTAQSGADNTGHLRHGTADGRCHARSSNGGSDGSRTYPAMASPGDHSAM